MYHEKQPVIDANAATGGAGRLQNRDVDYETAQGVLRVLHPSGTSSHP